jgi:hypothetical protein
VALLVSSLTLPAYSGEYVSSTGSWSTTATLVEENGAWVLAVVALPLIPVAAVAVSMWRRRQRVRPGAGPLAWSAVGVLAAFAFVTGFSIGLYVFPVVGLLAIACATFQASSSEQGSAEIRRPPAPGCADRPRRWIPNLAVAAMWYLASAVFPGPAMLIAFVVAVVALAMGVTHYRRAPTLPLPSIVFVAISLLAGSAALVLSAFAFN